MHRYPDSTPLTIDAFRDSGWRAAIEERERDGYSSMWTQLSNAARSASEAEEFAKARALWVLADACSMMLKPESPAEPFKPMYILEGRRSAVADDFTDEELEFMGAVVEDVDDPLLVARLADLLWLRRQPRRVEDARIAIDAYRRVALDHDTWVRDGRECWGRALALCRLLRGGAEDRALGIRDDLHAAYQKSSVADGYFAIWISRMMREYGLCGDHATEIAEKLTELGEAFGEKGELHRSRDYYVEAAQWYSVAGEEELECESIVAVAESWVKEARARTSGDSPSYMVGASFLESAIQTYRRIPRPLREQHNVGEKIDEIHREMNGYGELSLGEMGTIKSPPIDLTEMIRSAREAVKGKQTTEALLAFSNVSDTVGYERDRESAEEMIREHPLQGLFAATHMSSDGRVVAKTPGAGLGAEDSDEHQAAVWLQMVRQYTMGLSLSVQGRIWPAREVLLAEHRFREIDLISLARQSPIIPTDREELVGKGLFYGLEGDFAAAIHLLVPQIEHLVRVHLKAGGHKTTTLNQEGVEQEKGLSSLMDGEVPETIFGANLAFEIRALFCDPLGPNLRNETAHGLVSDGASQSIYAVYAWWFAFRLVFNTFWNAARREPVEGDDGDAKSSAGSSQSAETQAESRAVQQADEADVE